jgi:hypothetical protein
VRGDRWTRQGWLASTNLRGHDALCGESKLGVLEASRTPATGHYRKIRINQCNITHIFLLTAAWSDVVTRGERKKTFVFGERQTKQQTGF